MSDLELANCFIRSNLAPGVNYGGSLYFTSFNGGYEPTVGFLLRITNSEFEGNNGYEGGGMYCDEARGEIANTKIFDCQSALNGAGVYLARMGTDNQLDFTNCVFLDNFCASGGTATQGGGMYLGPAAGVGSGGRAKMVNCTFAGNACSGNPPIDGQALGVSATSQAFVYNSILFWNGSDGAGNPAPIAGAATVDYSDIEGGWPTGNNIGADPLFVDLQHGNLVLQSPASPCLDAADYGRLPHGTLLDVDGDGDLLEIIPWDIAKQWRWIDVPGLQDSGAGLYTFLDMGAYEHP